MEQLVEETTAASASFAGTLGYWELGDNYLFDLAWFTGFPESIPMAAAVETFNLCVSRS